MSRSLGPVLPSAGRPGHRFGTLNFFLRARTTLAADCHGFLVLPSSLLLLLLLSTPSVPCLLLPLPSMIPVPLFNSSTTITTTWTTTTAPRQAAALARELSLSPVPQLDDDTATFSNHVISFFPWSKWCRTSLPTTVEVTRPVPPVERSARPSQASQSPT